MRRPCIVLPSGVGEVGGWAEPCRGPADHQRAAELLESCTVASRGPLQRGSTLIKHANIQFKMQSNKFMHTRWPRMVRRRRWRGGRGYGTFNGNRAAPPLQLSLKTQYWLVLSLYCCSFINTALNESFQTTALIWGGADGTWTAVFLFCDFKRLKIKDFYRFWWAELRGSRSFRKDSFN